ncbi:MAG: hypothetical protein A2132_06250 [Nitrospirae bacterium RBG_16_43_11]|nr:MAG: hypothetical protein A2132_06250 [Nitrospirae bacterium RBG_16_43_11]HJW87059.1 DUF3854 domain-containing protein [Candidatus Brocadiaceae bacterium]
MIDNTNVEDLPGLSAWHVENLMKRGFTRETIITAMFKSVTHEQISGVVGFSPAAGEEARRRGLVGSPGIAIPFIDPINPTKLRDTRFRLDYPAEIGGKPAKYISRKGAGNLIYFPPGCSDKLQDISVPIFIVEGEFKALAAYQAGLFAVGLIGVFGWKGKGPDGQSQPIADFELIAWKGRQVIIVFDSDVATNPQVSKARHEFGKELYRRGAV